MFKVTLTKQLRSGLWGACGGFLDNEHDKGADDGHAVDVADGLSLALGRTLDEAGDLEMEFTIEEFGFLIWAALVFCEYAEDQEDEADEIATYQWAKMIEDRFSASPITL